MIWNTALYDEKHDFVSKYGEAVIALLAPKKGETILDVGCGTGDLAERIRKTGTRVVGMDHSEEMIETAREKYPRIDFVVGSASDFRFKEEFDAVFSNAALHWVLEQEKAIECIYQCLKKGGRFVAELGGKGNVNSIVSALKCSLNHHGYAAFADKTVWYFPSLSEYCSLLESHGFRVTWAAHFDRKTVLKEKDGIRNWIRLFCKPFLENLDAEIIEQIVTDVEQQIKPTNYMDNQWIADYVRLRVFAVK